jgi:hypothetical protein
MDLSNAEVIELWWHYEEVAMHFNNLIIQYRLQVMAGAGAIGALSSYLVAGNIDDPIIRHKVRGTISALLLLLITAAAIIDLAYYNELLRGSVNALLKLESSYDFLYLSTEIHNEFNGTPSYFIIGFAYGIIWLALFCYAIKNRNLYIKEESNKKKPTSEDEG